MDRRQPRHETLPKWIVLEGEWITGRLTIILNEGDPVVDYYIPDCIDAYLAQIVDGVFGKRNRMPEIDALASSLKHQYEKEGDARTAVRLAECILAAGLDIIRQLDMMGVYMPDGTTHYTFSGRDSLGGILLERIDTCRTTIA